MLHPFTVGYREEHADSKKNASSTRNPLFFILSLAVPCAQDLMSAGCGKGQIVLCGGCFLFPVYPLSGGLASLLNRRTKCVLTNMFYDATQDECPLQAIETRFLEPVWQGLVLGNLTRPSSRPSVRQDAYLIPQPKLLASRWTDASLRLGDLWGWVCIGTLTSRWVFVLLALAPTVQVETSRNATILEGPESKSLSLTFLATHLAFGRDLEREKRRADHEARGVARDPGPQCFLGKHVGPLGSLWLS